MQPDLYFGTLRLAEPGIALTGLFIAILCGYAWLHLGKRPTLSLPQRWAQGFFGLMAISSVLGPVFGHLFYYRVGFPGKYACWIFSILSLGALAQAAIEHARPTLSAKVYPLLSGLNIFFVLGALIISGLQQNFHWVEAHSAIALLGFLAPLEARMLRLQNDPGSRLFLWSLPVAVLAVVPHLLKWSPGIWFTYFDIGHIVLLGSLWLMLRGTAALNAPKTAVV